MEVHDDGDMFLANFAGNGILADIPAAVANGYEAILSGDIDVTFEKAQASCNI